MTDPEPNFAEDKEAMEQQLTEALEALTEIPAYTLTAEELADFKAAHYALRNLHPDFPRDHDIPEVYQAELIVTGDMREDT